VIALSVGERRREIGVRLALGARPSTVLALILGEGVRLAVIGIVIGIVAATLATRVFRGMLYEVGSGNLVIYAAAALIVGLIAIVSTWIPAYAATKVYPAIALRTD